MHNIIDLDVSGKKYRVLRETLMKRETKIKKIIEKDSSYSIIDENGNISYFIDMNPKYFEIILDYLEQMCYYQLRCII